MDNPNDPLLQALVEDAQALPQRVAAEVRARRRRRRRNILGSATATLLVASVAFWFGKVFTNRSHPIPIQVVKGDRAASPRSGASIGGGFVRVYPADAAAPDDAALPVATEEERKLLQDLGDAPALIVWNDAAQISRVHVFERRQ